MLQVVQYINWNIIPVECRMDVFNLKLSFYNSAAGTVHSTYRPRSIMYFSCSESEQLCTFIWGRKQTIRDTIECHVSVKGWKLSADKSSGALSTAYCFWGTETSSPWQLLIEMFESFQCPYLPRFFFFSVDKHTSCLYHSAV